MRLALLSTVLGNIGAALQSPAAFQPITTPDASGLSALTASADAAFDQSLLRDRAADAEAAYRGDG